MSQPHLSASSDYTAYVTAAWPRLFRTAYALTGSRDDAEDALQSVLAKAYTSWWRVTRAESPDAYVRRMLVNHVTSSRRRPWLRHERSTSNPPETAIEDHQGPVGESDQMWRAIRELPPRQRAIIVLRYYDDMTESAIATVMGIAPGTVKSQCSAAIKNLRAGLAAPSTAGEPR